jgi:transposase
MGVAKQPTAGRRSRMQLKTIFNRVQRYPGFVIGPIVLVERGAMLTVEMELSADGRCRPKCSMCRTPAPGYDKLPSRRFQFVPLWGLAVFLIYAPRRVDCAACGIRVEHFPWSSGKRQLTHAFAWYLATWAKRMSWLEVATVFRISWEHVFRSVELAVTWGLTHRTLDGIRSIGIDEVLWHRGHKYLTVVYQIDQGVKRLLWIGRDRTDVTITSFFSWFGTDRNAALAYVCSDMWKPYLKAIALWAKQAINVVDRFHVMQKFSKAVDEVRAKEAKALGKKTNGKVLKHTRWCLLKRPENLTEKQEATLKDLLRWNLKTVRAYLLKEDFQGLWEYVSPAWAAKFIDRWCKRAMRSRLEPMKKLAQTIRNHRPLILNWFKARGQLSSAAVEGLNNKLKVITRRSYGFRTFKATEVALYHTLGQLPEPDDAHRFC